MTKRILSEDDDNGFGYSFQLRPLYAVPQGIRMDISKAIIGVDVTKKDKKVGGQPLENMTMPIVRLNPNLLKR